jgi:hypothetical protein
VSSTTVKLLQAASDIVGGSCELAAHLGIGEALLAKFMDDVRPLPDTLLLRAVDIIISDRQSRMLPGVSLGLRPFREPNRDG